MEIIISKQSILTEVRKTLEYIGFRTITDNGGNVYDIVSATKEQEEMLDRFFYEGCTDIAHAERNYATATKGSDKYTYDYGHFNKYKEEITQDMTSYLVNYIIYQWLLLGNIAAERWQFYLGLADKFLRSYKNWFGSNTRADLSPISGGNDIGGDLPQQFAKRKVMRKRLCSN